MQLKRNILAFGLHQITWHSHCDQWVQHMFLGEVLEFLWFVIKRCKIPFCFAFRAVLLKGILSPSLKMLLAVGNTTQQPNGAWSSISCSYLLRNSSGSARVFCALCMINPEEFHRADECSINRTSVSSFFRKEGRGFPQTESWASSQWGTKNNKILQVQTQPNCKQLWMGLPIKSWSHNDGEVLTAFFLKKHVLLFMCSFKFCFRKQTCKKKGADERWSGKTTGRMDSVLTVQRSTWTER